MKYAFILFILFCCDFPALAQQEMSRNEDPPPKGYLALGFGPCIVTGDFGKSEFDSDSSQGFASNGYCYSILEFGFKFKPNFGLAGSIKGAIIPQDVQAWADLYAKEYGGQFTVTSTRWGYTAIYLGPFLSIPTKYVDFDFRFLTGLLFAESPEMTVSRGNEYIVQKSAFGGTISIQTGIGARFHLTKKFGVLAQAEYHVSNPVFDIEFYDNNNNTELAQGVGYLITTFNFTFGVAYRIF